MEQTRTGRRAARERQRRQARRRLAGRVTVALLLGLLASSLPAVTSQTPPSHARTAGVWLSPSEVAALPTSGAAWDRVRRTAEQPLSTSTSLSTRDDHATHALAVALVAARLNDNQQRNRAADALRTVMNAPPGTDLLAACRRLGTYVVVADLIGLGDHDPSLDASFRRWVAEMLHHHFSDGSGGANTIVQVHERRPNNWGNHAGVARIAAAVYLGDQKDLGRAAAVYRGYLGDRSAYDGFSYGRLSWQSDPNRPVGINPRGAKIDGRSVDGVLPDDQRRAGDFDWPPPTTNYAWEGLQGAVVQAQLLHRQGYDAWQWQDQALRRAVAWLYDHAQYPAEGDDTWIPWLVNHAYGSKFPTVASQPGKGFGFTDWTHSGPAGAPVHDSPFRDVDPKSTHGPAILELLERNITSGCAPDLYCPRDAVTREQMATFLVRTLDLPPTSERRFTDVAGTHAANVEALAAAGLTGGCDRQDPSRFCPKQPVSRAQMATFLAAARNLPATDERPFRDVGGTHEANISALAAAGITTGCNPPANDRFCPGISVSRAQMASFLTREP